MTPSFEYNRTKTKYFYYKCTSLSHGNGTKSNCPIRQISLAKFEATVLNLLSTLSSRPEFKGWQIKIQEHNTEVKQSEFKFLQEIKNTEAMITALKEKKDSFLEALVTNPFRSGERKLINGRIEELEAEIKRHNSQLFKLQFEHSPSRLFISGSASYASTRHREPKPSIGSLLKPPKMPIPIPKNSKPYFQHNSKNEKKKKTGQQAGSEAIANL